MRPPTTHRPRLAGRAMAAGHGSDQASRDARLGLLLSRAAAGDASAFEAFYDATFAYARTVARRLLRTQAEVEDLLADCYFEAWRIVGRYEATRGSPVTWLLTLVRSRGLDALRARSARPEGSAATPAYDSEGGAAESPTDPGMDPAEELWRCEAGALLHAALARLSAPERWVLGLAYLREMAHPEIARCTGMPLGTVKSHLARAQGKLRSMLTQLDAPLPGPGARAASRAAGPKTS